MAWKQKDAADLTGEASVQEGGVGVWGQPRARRRVGGGVKLACRRTGESLHRMLAFF